MNAPPTPAPAGVRVAVLTTVHDPRDTRIQKECRALIGAGYDVTLVAAGPRVVDSSVPQVCIPRPDNRRDRMMRTSRQAYRAARGLGADVYHFHDPELIPVGLALRRIGARVVYDIHEDYGGELRHRTWIPAPARIPVAGTTTLVERLASRYFDRLVVATPTIAAKFPGARTILVQNFPDPDELAPIPPVAFADRELATAYVGDINVVRGAREMVRAVAQSGLPMSRLYLGGRVNVPGLREELENGPGSQRVTFTGHLSRGEVRDLLARVRAGLVVLHATRNHVKAQPTKLYEYMSAGIPVVASDFPLWREVVAGARCGILVDPLSARAIADAIDSLLSDPAAAERMGQRGRAAVEAKYNWAPEADRLIAAYRGMTGGA